MPPSVCCNHMRCFFRLTPATPSSCQVLFFVDSPPSASSTQPTKRSRTPPLSLFCCFLCVRYSLSSAVRVLKPGCVHLPLCLFPVAFLTLSCFSFILSLGFPFFFVSRVYSGMVQSARMNPRAFTVMTVT